MTKLHSVPRPTGPEGAFFGVREDGVAGWAWDPDRPHDPLTVELAIDGESAGSVRAELFDEELANRRLGNGSHAFRFQLDRIPNLPCTLTAKIAGTDVELAPLRIETTTDLTQAVHPSVRFEGCVDELVPGRIHGWVLDRLHPGVRVRVVLRDWKDPLFWVQADIYRAGLEETGKGDGRCAFAILLPATLLNGQEHTLRVTVEDTDWELPGGRLVFDAAGARQLIEVIAPWRADAARIDSAIERLDDLISKVERDSVPASLWERIRRAIRG